MITIKQVPHTIMKFSYTNQTHRDGLYTYMSSDICMYGRNCLNCHPVNSTVIEPRVTQIQGTLASQAWNKYVSCESDNLEMSYKLRKKTCTITCISSTFYEKLQIIVSAVY